MIPILFDDGEKNYNTNGLGRLADSVSCTVTEERNGIYECEFEYPITGEKYDLLTEGQQILCTHDDTGDLQPFIIYGRTAPINGIVTFYAHHVSYALRGTVVLPFTASSVADALNKIGRNSVPANDFTFWTNKSTSGTFKVEAPRAARGLLGGEDGSILDVYGKGDYEWDRYTVKLYQTRGQDTEVEIRYGKNLSDLTNEIDAGDTYNAVAPFWLNSETGQLVTLPEGYIFVQSAAQRTAYLTDENETIIRDENDEPLEVTFRNLKAIPLDLSEAFETAPTVSQLRTAARSELEGSEGWVPTQNIRVDFVHMWETEEYKDYAPLQRVRLCDTVSVYYPELGVEAERKKVVKTTYNVLLDRYDEIELGDLQYSYAEIITKGILEEVPTTDMMDEAIRRATDLISGGLGGYVVLKPNANGEPEEILIMDTPDLNTAVNVIRMNKNGIAFSTNGYNGPFRTAWTIDGAFVADFITAGTLNANVIKAGVLSDVNGNTTFNLLTGLLNITRGSINLGNGDFRVNDAGYLVANDVNIGGFRLTSDVDGNYAFVQDATINGRRYRTWIRTATKDNEGGTWALSTQVYRDGVYRDTFRVNASGEMYVNPTTGDNTVAASQKSLSVYRDYVDLQFTNTRYVHLDSTVAKIQYSDTRGVFMDSSSIRMKNSGANFVSCDSSNGVIIEGGKGDASLRVTPNTVKMWSAGADVVLDAAGLTLNTDRTTTAHSGNLYVTSTGVAYRAKEGSSSRKIKRDIGPVIEENLAPERLYNVDVIQYKYKDEILSEDDPNKGKNQIGFIVEDLDEIYPTAVQKDDESPEDSEKWAWSPYRIIPPMLKLIQDQKKEIDDLKARLDKIEEALNENS